MDVAVLSDTHVPDQAESLPEDFREYVSDGEHVVHAGDFGSKDALADVGELAADLTAVYGNADSGDIDLPAVASVTLSPRPLADDASLRTRRSRSLHACTGTPHSKPQRPKAIR